MEEVTNIVDERRTLARWIQNEVVRGEEVGRREESWSGMRMVIRWR